MWARYYLVESLPTDSMRAARVGVRRETSDMGMSATGQGISLVPSGTLEIPTDLGSGPVGCVCKCMTGTAQLCWRHQPLLPVSASEMPVFGSQMAQAGYSRPTSY